MKRGGKEESRRVHVMFSMTEFWLEVCALTLLQATVHYCATATCTNDHCIHVFSYTTNICVANNTIIVKRKYLFLVTFTELLIGRVFLATWKHMRDTVIFNWLCPQKSSVISTRKQITLKAYRSVELML